MGPGGIYMYAVIRTGGKQFRVAPGDVIRVEKTPATNGKVSFPDVLAVSPEPGKIVGGNGASVNGQVVGEGRAAKILVFKFKRKKQYKKMQGHRQAYTAVRITEISFGGQKATAPEVEAKPKKEKKAAAPAVEATEKKAAAHVSKAHAAAKAHAKAKSTAKKAAKKPAAKKAAAGKKGSKKK